jgi:hypothetical protein
MSDKYTSGRRRVLKSAGAITGISALNVGQVSASSQSANESFVGVTYDPTTRAETGVASANIARSPDNLHGVIQLNKSTVGKGKIAIPLALNTPVSKAPLNQITNTNSQKYSSEFFASKGGDFRMNGRLLNLRISSIQNGDISGIVERPGHMSEDTAFLLGKVSSTGSKSMVRERLRSHIGGRVEVIRE